MLLAMRIIWLLQFYEENMPDGFCIYQRRDSIENCWSVRIQPNQGKKDDLEARLPFAQEEWNREKEQ
jgi:hypothetical protein